MSDVAIPLRCPPVVVQIGCNRHGRVPRERYRMDGVWGLHLYLYRGRLDLDGARIAYGPDDLTITPPDHELVWHLPREAVHHYALLRFPKALERHRVELPVLHRLGPAAARAIRDAWERTIAIAQREPEAASAWAWDLLWRLALRPGTPPPDLAAAGVPGLSHGPAHPALQNALGLIENDPAHPWSQRGLAARVGLSVNHLSRLFRAGTGTTVMGHVRQVRARRALHLLAHASIPIGEIARQIGMPDLHAVNRFLRRETGASPRRWRDGGRGTPP
jgi:AraC-like DNA-binding protein